FLQDRLSRRVEKISVKDGAMDGRQPPCTVRSHGRIRCSKHERELLSDTGIGGLTLGGGLGWLMSKHGLSCDNLLSADIVLADGTFLTASETENKELLWGLRGGGGNFGVVTSFQYQLYPIGPMVLGGMVIYPLAQAKEVLTFYRDYANSCPDDVT